jgi:hypothetical protein
MQSQICLKVAVRCFPSPNSFATQKHFLWIAKKDDPQVLNMNVADVGLCGNVGLVVSPAHVRSGDLVQLGVSKCSKPTKPRDPRATNLPV